MNKWKKWILMLCMAFIVSGCGSEVVQLQEEKELETGFIPARAGMYDSADTAVIKEINKSKKTITFYNLARERSYTLNYNGTSGLYDKYGGSLSIEQVDEGDIVDIKFLKEKKMLASLQMSSDAFSLSEVTRFAINEREKEISIGDGTYRFTDNLLIFSGGERVDAMDVNQVDTLLVQGIGHTVHSISVDKGHGYLRLKNDEYFWGGWIEIGQSIIKLIEEDMLLVVPEGEYDVVISSKGISGTKKVTIKRDKETELDIGDLKQEDNRKFGNLIFSVVPDTASIYIDGEEKDISAPVEVEYGIHQMMAKADGYRTVTQYIKVGQENATIQVTMEKDTEGSGSSSSSVSDNSTSSSTVIPPIDNAASANGGKITIDAPDGVEVYLDGSYVGVTPVSFKKTIGTHVITLRKTGYQTKSYTINIEETTNNESMSFSDLLKDDSSQNSDSNKTENSPSVSGGDAD